MNVNYNALLNPNHIPFFQSMRAEVLLQGATGAGKSYSIADKLLMNAIWYQDIDIIRILVLRKTFPALRLSALQILEERANALGLEWKLNKSEWRARCRNLEFIFLSLNNKDDYTKLDSMTNIDLGWMNELLDFRENDYMQVKRRLRGGKLEYNQVIGDYNPYDKYSWVHRRFYEDNIHDAQIFKYNMYDNHPEYLKTDKAQEFIKEIAKYKLYDLNAYIIYHDGEWGALEGKIFNWDVQPLPDLAWDYVWFGGDFGYSVNPATLTKIYRKADEYWLEEKIYETELTNRDLSNLMKVRLDEKDLRRINYWDSAEPKSIQELVDEGIHACAAVKGPDSVRTGIDFMKSLKIHIVEGSENIIKEHRSYVWKKDRDGKSLNEPITVNDHAMDGSRYGIYSEYILNQRVQQPFIMSVVPGGRNEATV